MTLRPKYKELYLSVLAQLEAHQKAKYDISSNVLGDEDCEHDFPQFGARLESWGSGFVHSTFVCNKCDFEVTQFMGEQHPPETVPSKEEHGQIRSWEES